MKSDTYPWNIDFDDGRGEFAPRLLQFDDRCVQPMPVAVPTAAEATEFVIAVKPVFLIFRA